MSDVVDKLEWLSNIAAREDAPPLFGREEFFTRLRRKTNEEEFFPLRLFTGIGAVSAAAAGIVLFLALNAWAVLNDPLARGIQTFMEVMP